MENQIASFFEDAKFISDERFEMVSRIHQIFLRSQLNFDIGYKYGGITYNLSGELVSGMFAYSEHISIEFSCGADFSDPYNVLEGKGKHRRHIKIRTLSDIQDKHICDYIDQIEPR